MNALHTFGVTARDAGTARHQLRKRGVPVPRVKIFSLIPALTEAQKKEIKRGVRIYHVSGLKKAERIRLFIQEHPGMGNKQIANEFSQYSISENFVRAVKSQTRKIREKVEHS